MDILIMRNLRKFFHYLHHLFEGSSCLSYFPFFSSHILAMLMEGTKTTVNKVLVTVISLGSFNLIFKATSCGQYYYWPG